MQTDTILHSLTQVTRERAARAADAALQDAVVRLKSYQQERFRNTYRDLLDDPRYAAATRFFLEELYGPADHTLRDREFERIVPAIARLFPRQVVATVNALAELHALSERLDTEMGRKLKSKAAIAPADYVAAWQATDQRADRERQIALALEIGAALDHYTRSPLLRRSLHLMRRPARAAGLETLQGFLERGFDAFGTLGGAASFLATIESRERSLAAALFEPALAAGPSSSAPGLRAAWEQLP